MNNKIWNTFVKASRKLNECLYKDWIPSESKTSGVKMYKWATKNIAYVILNTLIYYLILHDWLAKGKRDSWKQSSRCSLVCTILRNVHTLLGSEDSSYSSFIFSACHLLKPMTRASLIHACLQFSIASGMVTQLLFLVFCSGQNSSSSLTNKAYIAALHNPSGLNSSCCVLLLKW